MSNLTFDLKKIRHTLHKNPELSGKEEKTSKFIFDYLLRFQPDVIFTKLCNYGLLAVFDSKKSGPTIIFRAELDALPINEENNYSYSSQFPNVSHSCGHDGHMSILLGLASILSKEKLKLKGKVILLFQPAEETANGAKCIVKNAVFSSLKPDYIFSIHNLPGFKKGQIVIKKGIFASASIGLIINLTGKTSHAGQPEKGNSPVNGLIEILRFLVDFPKSDLNDGDVITVIHIEMGEVAFGTSPGKAAIMATLRSYDDKKLESIKQKITKEISKSAEKFKLEFNIVWVEEFPSTLNDNECVDIVRLAADKLNREIKELNRSLSWSEDFSYYLKEIPGALFGIGSGINHPSLHNENYDFPDEIIETGIDVLFQIVTEIVSVEME
ncbi:MAG: amidohydrolase [Candidatus Thermoplasmatota archaeon]|nr:amidohydrolase [Candidatus Thermoplasmatota archaeon]